MNIQLEVIQESYKLNTTSFKKEEERERDIFNYTSIARSLNLLRGVTAFESSNLISNSFHNLIESKNLIKISSRFDLEFYASISTLTFRLPEGYAFYSIIMNIPALTMAKISPLRQSQTCEKPIYIQN